MVTGKQICDAIVAYLQVFPGLPALVAARTNMAFVRQEADTRGMPVCFVHPVGITLEKDTRGGSTTVYGTAVRGTWQTRHDIYLTLVQQLNTEGLAEQDELIKLAQALPLLLDNEVMAGAKIVSVNDDTTQILFEEAEMAKGHFFSATVALTYLEI